MPPPEHLSWLVGELRALASDLSAGDSDPPLVVAIDQGGHASRAIAFEVSGRLRAEAFTPISTFRRRNDRVEHDPNEVDESIRTALADLHQALGDSADRVIAAGLATQRSSIVCWDLRANKALTPILSWQDRRNAAWIERLRSQELRIRETTGLPLTPHYGASKMRWCLDNVPEVQDAAGRKSLAMGPLAAWLLRSLLSERPFVVDPVNAARTQLLDLRTGDWSGEMLELFGISRTMLPHVVANRYSYGHIAFGDRSIPLVVCTGDQSAMPFAHGQPAEDTIYLNIGTGAFVQRLARSGEIPDGMLGSVLWRDEQDGASPLLTIEGTVNGAASAIDWLNERCGIAAHRAALSLTRAEAGDSLPLLFLNGVSGVGSPFWRPNLEPRFIGDGSDEQRVIAVVESIAFLICENIARIRDGATRILASGGLAASDYLCECIASLSGITLERTSLQEATATGLAYLVAGAPAEWQPQAELERFEPMPHPPLHERFERWRREMANV
ncbi:MAG TPA: FGGY family carbohydrate kinase [Steroidobacteraceae bacterium]